MSRIPARLYVLFGALAVVAGVLGVSHAPSGVPKAFWSVMAIVGACSLVAAWLAGRHARSS